MAFDQRKYIDNFNKINYKLFSFRIRKDDVKVMNKLTNVSNLNKYIHSLIEKDINDSLLSIKQIKERIIPILNRHNIYEIYLFGSYARGEANVDSDVDIYCEAGDVKTLVDQGFLEEELEKSLEKKVDIIFADSTLGESFKKELDKDKIKLC